jgi:hypothetical protein
MTTHDLARKLLQLPDVPVTIPAKPQDSKELTEDDLSLFEDTYIDTNGTERKGPNLYIA